MQIAFWSTVHGQTATTTNLISIALMTALEYRLKILITQTHFEKSTLESSLLNKKFLKSELTELNDTGMDALCRSIHLDTLDKEHIANYTTTILNNRLDLLIGTGSNNKDLFINDLFQTIDLILNAAKNYYDLIFIDVPSGTNSLSKKIVQQSDYLMINLNQNLNVIENFFTEFKDTILENSIILLGMYDDESRYNVKTLKRRFNIKNPIITIPYCRELADYCNEGRAVDFFIKNIKSTKSDYYYSFINEVRKGTKKLLKNLGVHIDSKRIGD